MSNELPSTHVAAVVRYGEKRKHLYRQEDDPVEFKPDLESALLAARQLVLECDPYQQVVVMKIEFMLVPKKSFDERRVDGEAVGREEG